MRRSARIAARRQAGSIPLLYGWKAFCKGEVEQGVLRLRLCMESRVQLSNVRTTIVNRGHASSDPQIAWCMFATSKTMDYT
jgi:hypothetical protein